MKLTLFSFILLSLIFTACDNEINLIEGNAETPVIYGLISSSDTAQYIRVERAFVDATTSALTLAEDPDNFYYANVNVILIDGTNQRYTLQQVDGNEEGYPRQDGVFANSPNTLYKINSSDINITPGDTYTLEITYSETESPVTASTVLLDAVNIDRPNSNRVLNIVRNGGFDVSFRADPNAAVFDVYMLLRYEERIPGQISTEKVANISLANGIEDTDINLDSDVIYSKIAGAISTDPTATRIYKGISMVVEAGGQELANYINVGQANLGITSSQNIPTYTNLSSGVGIFSSRVRTVGEENLELAPVSADSLVNGRFTKDLNFQF